MSIEQKERSHFREKTSAGGHRLSDTEYNRRKLARLRSRCVVDENGCWLWQGFIHPSGYGQASYRGQSCSAHRASFLASGGVIPEGYDVCHSCRPRHCINPDHLRADTRKENIREYIEKDGHYKGRKTHCWRGHALTPDNVYLKQYRGYTHRCCRFCDLIKNRLKAGWTEQDALNTPRQPLGYHPPRKSRAA